MKIGINALTLSDNNSGIGNYTINLINNLANISDDEYILFSSCGPKIRGLINEKIEIIDLPLASKNKYTRLFTEQVHLPLQIKREKIDLMLNPAFTMPLMAKCRNIVTVHDMAYKIYGEGSAIYARIYMRLFFDSSIKRADEIITVSESTKRDLIKYFPDRKNVKSIHLGTIKYSSREKERPEALMGNDKFLLVVGTITPRKNNLGIIKAFDRIKDMTDCKLLFAGGFAWKSDEIHEYIKDNNLEDRVLLPGYLSDEELAWSYENAEMLLYCSFYEGFGFPPIEAMASGTPVIASNVSSIPEVAGDAAILVDPHDLEMIGEKILQLLNDDELRNELITKGNERHRLFTWEKTAEETLKVIKE